MPIPPEVVKCYKHIDSRSKSYIEELRRIVKIPNVSSDPDAKDHLAALIQWMTARLRQLGFSTLLKQPDYRKYKANK